MPAFGAGALAVEVISGAYRTEVFRAAFLAIAQGRARGPRSAVGMNRTMAFRRIIVPQVLRFALPGLGNLWQVALKDSSLISVTGLTRLMGVSFQVSAELDPPAVRLLSRWRRCALSRGDGGDRPRVFDIRAETRATRGMRRAAA